MFALSFRFPAGRYHATPWGRNVNEADVAWPPEPWRLLRTLVATWWRKGDRTQWSEDDLARLVDALAESPPEYTLPEGAIHSHTRHYMPSGGLDKGRPRTTLVFDAFLRLPRGAILVAAWPDVTLASNLFALAEDLASAVGYLGRAESWAECEALSGWAAQANCKPLGAEGRGFSLEGDLVRALAPLSPSEYSAERRRLLENLRGQILRQSREEWTERRFERALTKKVQSKRRQANTLPERVVDALMLDTADYQDCGWSRPPASREVIYARGPRTAPGVAARGFAVRGASRTKHGQPTVARFLLAGHPRPRVEDAVRIGELMRRAALSKFGWDKDDMLGRWLPRAPWKVSGRDGHGRPLRDPEHVHAFWLPEDADGDGWIDHVSVYIAGGMNDEIQRKLDRITRLWLSPTQRRGEAGDEPCSVQEWRLALEGFGRPSDFAEGSAIFGAAARWRSVTPFLAAGHLKKSGYAGEVRRVLSRRGVGAADVDVRRLPEIMVGSRRRRTLHFRRFRSRGREAQRDTAGAFLEIVFPGLVQGPLALGFGSHFGLGLFSATPPRME